tara:strand:- start:13 stop:531 length:519 start_codon:yes stop_codon:yes gene_type:complete
MNRVLNTETRKKIASAVAMGVKAEKAQNIALDLLIADGFDKPSDYISPKSDGSTVTEEEWESMKDTVTKGFSARIQALIEKPTDSLNEVDKADKRYWQQQKGSIVNRFGKQLAKRLAKLNPEQGAGPRKRTVEQRVRDNLNDVIKVCQDAGEPRFDVPEMIATVKAALRLIK